MRWSGVITGITGLHTEPSGSSRVDPPFSAPPWAVTSQWSTALTLSASAAPAPPENMPLDSTPFSENLNRALLDCGPWSQRLISGFVYQIILKYFSARLRFRMECKRALGKQKTGERKYFYGLKREHPKAAWAMDLHDLAPRVGVYW